MFYLALSLLKLVAFGLSWLPGPLFGLVGRGLGAALRLAGFRSEIVRGNLAIAFPDHSHAERERLRRAQYAELGHLFLEIFRSFFRFDRWVERRASVEGEEHLRAALAKGKGVFVFTAHLGNWEVLTVAGPALFGTGVTMVTKELKPAWLHRVILVTRELLGVRMACEPRTMPGILRALKRKEIVGFVMDQYAGAPVGARVPFFGVPVGSHTALAALALRTGAPVVPAVAIRLPDGRFRLRFDPELPLAARATQDEAIVANTALFVRHVEGWVREWPEQWLWIHRRWKGDLSSLPPGSEGELLR